MTDINIVIEYIKKKKNTVADIFSRQSNYLKEQKKYSESLLLKKKDRKLLFIVSTIVEQDFFEILFQEIRKRIQKNQ